VIDDWAVRFCLRVTANSFLTLRLLKSYNATLIASLKQVTLATMDALQNFFFWTWKIGNSTVLGTSSSPLWHYQLGLEKGWIPKGASDRSIKNKTPRDL
jgi:hypothetical protein